MKKHKKILFTHSYFYRFDAKQWHLQQPYPPYGTIYAAALMRERGYEVSFFDTNLRHSPNEIEPLLAEQRPEYLVIYDDGFNYLTKMCLTNMRQAAFQLAALGKKYGCTVCISSSDSTDHFELYLDQNADFVLLGEAELTLEALLEEIEKDNPNYQQLLGIAYRDASGYTQKNARRPVLQNLDSLPNPAWDLVDIEAYKQIWKRQHGYFSLNIATTRGCPYKCNWCAKPIYGNRYNSRSPERVADEINLLVRQYGAEHFWVCDDIFGLKPGWVQQFSQQLQSRQLTIGYKIQSRADLLLKEDTIAALAQSGLKEVWIGAESGSQAILDAMDKGTTVEQIYEATRLIKQHGIRIAFFLQFGYLGETQEDIEKTIQMVLDLMPDDIGISVSYPLPGTPFYEKVKTSLQQKQNWAESDDLDMMWAGTFNTAYYKQLHRYLHKLYRREQGYQQLPYWWRNVAKGNFAALKPCLSLLYYIPTTAFHRRKLTKIALNNP